MAVVGVRLQAFNWRMYEARKAMGLTQVQLGQLCGFDHHQKVGRIESLRQRPTREDQDEIASALDVDVAELFPPEVLDLYGEAPASIRIAVPAERLAAVRDGLGTTDPARLLAAGDLPRAVRESLQSLTPRERTVIALRFGLDGGGERTLRETSRETGWNVTPGRIRQIEAKALRNLRHPSRSKPLVAAAEPEPSTRIPQGHAPAIGPMLKAKRQAEMVKSAPAPPRRLFLPYVPPDPYMVREERRSFVPPVHRHRYDDTNTCACGFVFTETLLAERLANLEREVHDDR